MINLHNDNDKADKSLTAILYSNPSDSYISTFTDISKPVANMLM